MTHPLDRAVFNALTTRLSRFTTPDSGPDLGSGAVRLDPEVGVFLAAADDTAQSRKAMAELARRYPGAGLVELEDGPMAEVLPEGAPVAAQVALVQMTATALTPAGPAAQMDDVIEELGEADAPAMLALATLTRPGPFRSRTRELGPFVGIKQDGELVAMAGRRLRVDGFTELSGVCTHPDYRGKGYAAALSRVVVSEILATGEAAFLHAFADHETTIAFYRGLGFQTRARMIYTSLGEA
ncbi:GNAT family N-acetyltransferase [Brevundimonas pondensis]|jgi:predicted GNAT family acetyltransferase|uniref:GNAT family N-acetyltransferase n=1 Tax=Brevundimonas pondensis TaxID=2774189 RepID=A0ABX7SMV0_9CAUL|nr:GNAT family N-acetyltransferase [Brevundimonas pondensis]QTC87768.1 GNAT family N-acetyltransferase [Brevundimonas pondensis]